MVVTKEKRKEYSRKYYLKNREKYRAYARAKYHEDREAGMAETARWMKNNRKKWCEYIKARQDADPTYPDRQREYIRRWAAKQKRLKQTDLKDEQI